MPPMDIATDGVYRVRPSSDLYFRISNKTAVIPARAATIPSLSQWGLLIFGLLVLNLGVGFVYKVTRLQNL